MYCPKCGTENPDDARNCSECSINLRSIPTLLRYQHSMVKPEANQAAGFWRRLGAGAIDLLILVAASDAVLAIVASISVKLKLKSDMRYWLGVFTIGVVTWVYYCAMESSHAQATLGKLALGAIVTDSMGRKISFARATARFFSKVITLATGMIGFIIVSVTPKQQALHDYIARTNVVLKEPASGV